MPDSQVGMCEVTRKCAVPIALVNLQRTLSPSTLASLSYAPASGAPILSQKNRTATAASEKDSSLGGKFSPEPDFASRADLLATFGWTSTAKEASMLTSLVAEGIAPTAESASPPWRGFGWWERRA